MSKNTTFISLFLLLFLCACNGNEATKIDVQIKQPRPLVASLTSVSVVNDRLVIRGTGLSAVTKIELSGESTSGSYRVESSTAHEIIAYASSAAAIGIGKTIDLLIGNAQAQAGYQISFELDDNSITAAKISSMGAATGQVLKFNGTNWVPTSLPNSQMYLGSFEADTNNPDLSSPSSNSGDYYIVSVAGTFNGISYDVGDWIISDGVAWQRIANAAPAVNSFEGRTGSVVLVPGDYVSLKDPGTQKLTGSSLEDIADVDMTGLAANKVLKYDGTSWVVADDLSGGGAASVGTTQLQDSSVTYQKISLTDGELPQAKVNGLVSAFTTVNSALAGKISRADLSATAPLVYSNTTGDFTVSAATTSAAGTMSGSDKTKLDSVTVSELGYLAGVTSGVQVQLDDKLATAGGTVTGNLIVDSQLQLKDGATANYVTLKAPASGTASYTLTFPATVGTANQVLTTNASGVLSWTTIGTATAVGGDLSGSVANATITANAVTSGKVLDGTLVDADLSPSAAIAQSKVANLTSDLGAITTSVSGKIGLINLSATAPLAYDNTSGAFTVSAATTSAAGTLSSSDKTKLDGLEALSVGDGLFERFSGVVRSTTCSAGEVLKWNAVGGWICGSDLATDASKLALVGGTLTGNLVLNTEMQLKDGATANYVIIKAPASGTTSYTLTLPPTVGTANQVLATNASGVLSWATVATSATSVGGDLTGTIASATIAADAVTSGKVLDGTLGDADINASAAIAQSKVANLTTDLSTINTSISSLNSSVSGKIGLTNLSATAPLVYNNTTGAFTVSAASGSAAGTMSAADKTKLDGVTATELGYVTGVTSAVQGQLDSKLDEAGGTLTGNLVLNTNLQLKDGAAANYVTLKAPASGTTSYTLTLPPTVGTANQVLATNASGVLSWATVATSTTSVGGDLSGTISSATIVADAVTSGKVLDGTLVDADINASAAIAQSKIANLTTDLSTINTNVSGKIGLTALSAASPLVYNNATGAFTVSAASGSAAGTLSAADKTKLDTLEALSASNGLLERFSGVIRSNTCSPGEVLKWNAISGWTCGADDATDATKLPLAGGTLTGNLVLNTEMQLKDGAAANYVTIKAPASGTTSYTLTLPPTVGTANQVLATNASGVLSWATVATSATSVGGDLTGTIASATIAADAVTSGKILDGTLVDADINASAAIAQSKIANLTSDLSTINTNVSGKIGLTSLSATAPLVYNNATGAFTVSAANGSVAGTMSAADKTKLDGVTTTELGYIAGVTSALQGQLDDKLPEVGGSMTGDLTLETQLKLKDGATASYVNLRAPASGTTSYTLTFPPAVGSANQVLTTNASGVLSWTTIGTATAVGGDLTGTIASATIAADAVTSGKILDGTLVDADINATAAIAQSKIANLTTDLTTINTNVSGKIGLTALSATAPLAYNNATGAFTVSAATGTAAGTMSAADKTKLDAVTTTELGYVSGVTSALQGQIDSKFDKAGGTLTGNLIVNTELQLKDGATSNYVTLKAPATGTTSYTLTFPAAVGSANQVLTTNASGVLTWTTIGTATSVGGDLTGTVANATIATSSVTSGKVLDGTLVDADINASAAIAQSKIANLTTDLTTINTNVAGKIGLTALSATGPLAYNNTTGAFTVSAASGTAAGTMSSADKAKLDSVTSTELGYVAGVTSALQGQLDAKLAKAGGSMTGDLTLETQLNLKDGASANYVNLRAPASGTTTYTLTFPPSVGSANQVLTTSASGVLSWTTIGTATSVGGDLTGTVANATIAASSVTSGKVLDGTLVDADVNASAAIAQSKINNLTTDLSTITTNVAGKIGLTALSATAPLTYNNTTGAFTVSAATGSAAGTLSAADKTKLDSVTATELGYVSGVTSALQGQIDAKFDKAGGTLTGNLLVNTQLQLKDGAVANYVTLKAPASGTTSYTLTFPGTVGSANQVLTTDASGVLSWTTIGTSTSVGGDLTGTVANSTIATSAVTSGKVLDGTLVDADINATAAIAQSKVANLTTDLAGKIGLTALSASAPLVYTNTTGAFSITAATISAAGSMSSADKTKMDALEILSSGNGLFERFSGVISSNTCAAGEVLSWNAVTGWDCTIVVNSLLGTVTPSNVVIANGDTIAAAFDKTQGQIAVKANIASPTFTGIPAAPTATAGTNTTQVATTAFVDAAVQKYVVLSGVDVVNITVNTMANVTGLSFPVTAGVTYEFEFFIVYTSATANGSRWSISGPASTFLHYDSQYSFTTTTQSLNPGLSGYDLPIGVNATSAYATSNIASIKGVINASVTGSVIARFASETISGVTAKAGRSYVKYRAL